MYGLYIYTDATLTEKQQEKVRCRFANVEINGADKRRMEELRAEVGMKKCVRSWLKWANHLVKMGNAKGADVHKMEEKTR